jgi:hypothetical protein
MKQLILLLAVALTLTITACSKSDADNPNSPRTDVPAELRGNWMFGNFSMTEYWSQNPGEYIGNGLEYAFAFTFNADGTYTQYFTSGSVSSGVQTYQQSVTNGTVEVDAVSKVIKTHPSKAHYRRTVDGQVAEDRDLSKEELSTNNSYTYTTGVEPSGTDALYLTLNGTDSPLTFLRKP